MAFLAFRPPRLSGTRLVGTLQANYLDKARPNEGTVREVRDGVSRRVGVQADAPLVGNHQAIGRSEEDSSALSSAAESAAHLPRPSSSFRTSKSDRACSSTSANSCFLRSISSARRAVALLRLASVSLSKRRVPMSTSPPTTETSARVTP